MNLNATMPDAGAVERAIRLSYAQMMLNVVIAFGGIAGPFNPAYSTFVGVLSAPMPLLGGWLVSTLTAAGYAIDLRLTFLAWSVFMFAAAGIAWRLHEPGSITVPAFVFSYFPARRAGFLGINLAPMNAPFTATGRFQGKP